MRRSPHALRAPLALAALLGAGALAACGGSAQPAEGPAGTPVTVAVQPPAADVLAGAAVQFAPVVAGTLDTGVTWDVVEAGGGSVDATGRYVAPQLAGVFHVRARSVASPSTVATAAVTVRIVSISILPATTSVAASGNVTFTATVTGTPDTAVTWAVREASGCGSVSAAGVYTAPPSGATCHVVATSVADPARTATATITVTPPAVPVVTVAIAPTSAALDACRTQTFTATVTGTTNRAVTWSVTEGAPGGTVTASGLYTAPDTAGTYHLVATSQASPTASASIPITVAERVLGVAVSPANLSLAPGATGQFTATVTTTCGAFTSVQTVTAPVAN